ncbi:hypothetical protein DM01DRAFT_1400603 [Hesseltinella vesiculosa]|uniref:Dilute domain-containing protein n=1 Tax=Hesseltinella vesiculosa TaxID=101127 RepID=A0A1X2G3L4_9FUNG|nr:hypothetical protein DM01DRAFT_1400603 [Hesseltinella vesiculosa]
MGTTPLIYAACFGYVDIVDQLLQMDVDMDKQDKSKEATIYRRYQSHVLDDFDRLDQESTELDPISCPSSRSDWTLVATLSPDDDDVHDMISCERSLHSIHHFAWNRCLPDQMYVYAEEDIDHLLTVLITNLKLPMKTRQENWLPANVLFLAARYAHYYANRELLQSLLGGAMTRIASVLQENNGDIHTLAFWLANLTQMLYYLKRDTHLVVATAEQQLEISELVSETYALLVTDSERRLEKILEASMLTYDSIGGEPVQFSDDWQRFFRRRGSSRRPSSMMQDWPTCTLSPHSITSLLSSILYVLQSYEVHPSIIVQAIAQFFYFLGSELFNRILMQKKYTCRSKALQVRMNLSVIEDWLREQQPFLPGHLTNYLDPLIQLLQLLQCVSQLNDLHAFINTTQGFDLLNPLQIRRCVMQYRYEVDEPRLPDVIEKHTTRLAQPAPPPPPASATPLPPPSSALPPSVSPSPTKPDTSPTSSRPTSVSSLGSLLMSKWTAATSAAPTSPQDELYVSLDPDDDDHDLGHDQTWYIEQRDARYTLPFSLPTTSAMMHYDHMTSHSPYPAAHHPTDASASHHPLSTALYQSMRQKLGVDARCRKARERMVVPSVPQDWIPILDRQNDGKDTRTAMDANASIH